MEKILHEDDDETAWVCLCGNTPDSDGFATCDANGNAIEPNVGGDWTSLYACNRCDRIIDQTNLEVVGHRKA